MMTLIIFLKLIIMMVSTVLVLMNLYIYCSFIAICMINILVYQYLSLVY